MPRFFFDIGLDARGRDSEGEMLESVEAARAVALVCMSEVLPLRSAHMGEDEVFAVSVRDDQDHIVHRVRVSLESPEV